MTDFISYEDFSKVELKVATIIEAQKIEESEKLIKLQVSLGEEKRQIVAGIAKSYSPEELIGKQIIIVANLEPRKLMGYESQGMLLAASGENGPIILTTEKEAQSGQQIS
jgi:methionyl-tRNA synthetase